MTTRLIPPRPETAADMLTGDAVLAAVEPLARRAERTGRRPVFVLDADGTAVLAVERMQIACIEVAPDGLPELAQPSTWGLLPGLHQNGFSRFVTAHGLDLAYPHRNWAVVHAAWLRFLLWTRPALCTDFPSSGLAAFAHGLRTIGVEPIVCTARPWWMVQDTVHALESILGLTLEVYDADRENSATTAAGKIARLTEREACSDAVLGGVDDEVTTILACAQRWPDALWLHYADARFTTDPTAVDVPGLRSLSTFETAE